jgi:arsenate reductase
MALAQAQDLVPTDQPEVLFVCVHNAGRSQMAAGLLKLRSNGQIHVRSAGSAPGEEINPAVIRAMEEVGVDMSQEFPKPLTDEFVQAADVVITMGCGGCLPDLSRQALRGLGAGRSGRAGRGGSALHPRPDRRAGAAADG